MQGLDVGSQCGAAGGGQGEEGLRAAPAAILAHADIVGCEQFFQMGIEIAVRNLELAFQFTESLLAGTGQKGN